MAVSAVVTIMTIGITTPRATATMVIMLIVMKVKINKNNDNHYNTDIKNNNDKQ